MQERRVVNEVGVASWFNRVYAVVGGGIAITGLISALLGNVYREQYVNFIGSHQIMFYVMTFLPLILSFFIYGKRARANAAYASVMFVLISAAFGFTYASLWLIYPAANITAALFTTAVVFISMSVVGRTTKTDLSRAGGIAYTALWGIILMSLVNFFIGSSGMSLLISYAVLIVFIILTAWDNQSLKRMYMQASGGQLDVSMNSLAIMGALQLYLDFLNLFLAILQIFGGNDNN
ncbi:Bax inhibitor-1/YccA family protein [Lacticaseibacillus nasuensis]|nr:Bax inhibitor-1/YccA family protein [Lacticaseibacillus nasuensis]MCX2455385.1 Bax inhibitor-1/YccA family protein [Lacticaseibacillus nasuensis]